MTAPLPIGAAILDPVARTLTGPGVTVRLPDQAVKLLAHLAAHAGRVVSRLDATDAMYGAGLPRRGIGWPTMQARVCLLRRALRDVGSGAEIATLPNVGIRLDVPAVDGARDAREAA